MLLQMGRLIRQLRKQQGMTQEELGKGILSKSALSRVENEVGETDILILNALLFRLGKSLEPFEIVVPNRQYEELKKGNYIEPLHTTIMAEGEFFKDLREAKGLTQEEFSGDIYARETISNIENGRTPQYKKLEVLMEKLGEPLERYYGYVIAQEFSVYEHVTEYQEICRKNTEAAKLLRQKIAGEIDNRLAVNQQFLESSEILEQLYSNNITPGEALAALERCLRYTMPEYDGKIYRIPRCQETVIIKYIILCMKAVQRKEAAKELKDIFSKKIEKKLKIS